MNKKRILLGLANYSLLILSCLFYWLGYRLWMIFFMLQLFLTALNFNIARSKKSLAVWSTHLLISTITANLASTLLYYNIISSDSMLELATVTYKVGDRTATFKVTGLPQGKRAWVLESNRMTLTEGDELVLEDCRETYHSNPVLSTDALAVSRRGQALTLTNTSGRKLTNVTVYYKNTLEDGTYMGGISYLISFGEMEPGVSVTRTADHFDDTSEIVRYSFQ